MHGGALASNCLFLHVESHTDSIVVLTDLTDGLDIAIPA